MTAACVALSGCANTMDTISNWFSAAHKSTLKGERISLLSTDAAVKPDPTLANTPIRLPAPYHNTDWTQPGGFPSNATYHLDAPGPLREIWDADAGKGSDATSRLTASPVVADGRIYTIDAEAHVYAYNQKTGREVWDKRLAPKNGTDMPTLWGLLGKSNTIEPASGMGGGVAYDAGKLFATSGFGVVYALDAKTGERVWGQDIGVPIVNAPVVSGGRIFVSTHDNHFYALAESNGRQLWSHQGIPESAGVVSSTSAAVSGEFVIAPYSSGEVYALQVQNGQVAWSDVLTQSGQVTSLSALDDIAGRPVIDRDVVYAISHSGLMAAINLSTGDRVWSRDIGGTQTPLAAGDYVYVITGDSQILCLTRKEGKVRWVHQLPQYEDESNQQRPISWNGPLLVSDKLIATSSNGYLEAISPYTGQLLGKIELDGGTSVAPIAADGTVYVYTDDAELMALR
ncbi:MAG TPA: PQQ-binding-like beta-propeller repeat protein [Rhizomicrobium sp.]|nr:PQQ-binding-like beta-propeller repeat protein [Rhizomicrobium sp.]